MEIIALLVKSPLIAVLVSILLALVYLWLKRVMEQTFGLGIRLWEESNRPRFGNYRKVQLRRHYGGFARGSWVWVQTKKLLILQRHEVIDVKRS